MGQDIGNKPRKGWWVVIEGIDGSGKSSLVEGLRDHLMPLLLNRFGSSCVRTTCEPTYGPAGKTFRELASKGQGDPRKLLRLLIEDRMSHHRRIRSLLQQRLYPFFILQDRYWHSTVAYQSKHFSAEVLTDMHEILFGDLEPDLVLWVDTPPEVARARLAARGAGYDALEEDLEAKHKVYRGLWSDGYMVRVGGDKSREEVKERALEVIRDHVEELPEI